MDSIEERAARAAKIASVLRPLGNGVLSRKQAERAAQLYDVIDGCDDLRGPAVDEECRKEPGPRDAPRRRRATSGISA